MSKRKLFNQLSSYDSGLTKTPYTIVGLLGVIINGEQVVEVPTRNSYLYVRLRDSSDELIQAFNDKVAPVYDLPVVLTYKNGRYVITGRDIDRYGDWGGYSAYLPRHGSTHSFVESGGGTDIVWVYGRQFMPYLAQPSGSGGSEGVILNGYTFLKSDGTWRYDGQTGSASLLSYKPTGTSNARMVLIYEDMQNGVYGYSAGSEFNASITGTSAIIPYIPTLSNANYNPIAAVRLVSGTSRILWGNLYDVRQFFRMQPTGTGAGNLNVYDEGALLGAVTGIDFVGNNVTASVSGTRARVFITGSVGGGGVATGTSTVLNYEDVSGQFISGSYVTHFTLTGTALLGTDRLYYNGLRQQRPTHYTLDSDGRGFTTVFTGTYDDVLVMDYGIIGGTGGSSGTFITVQDEGTPLGAADTFNFIGSGVAAALAGTVANVTVSGGGGGRTLISGAYPSSTTTVSFPSIPQTYSKLELDIVGKTANATVEVFLYANVNGDTNNLNYYAQWISGYSTNVVAGSDLGIRYMGMILGRNVTGSYGFTRVEIPFYNVGNGFKMMMWNYMVDTGAANINVDQGQGSTVWRNKDPITSLDVISSNGNYITGTVINLYGVS